MPILKMPEYVTGSGPKTATNPTTKKIVLPQTQYGYTGSGWNYPSASAGGATVHYPTTPGAAPSIVAPGTTFDQLPATTVPGYGGLPAGDQGPPSLDLGPYMSELTSDPLYQSGLTSYQGALQGNRNALNNAVRQALIKGGWAPGKLNLSNVGGQNLSDLYDQATIDAATGNQMSDRAQLGMQLEKGLAGVAPRLAARGAARSGAANIEASNLQSQYDVASYGAMQNLAAALSGDVSSWAQNDAGALGTWNAAQANVANRLAQIASARAQAAYGSSLADWRNQPQQVNLGGGTQITSAPTGPAPATAAKIAAVKKAVAQAKKISTAGYGGGGWTYNGVTYG